MSEALRNRIFDQLDALVLIDPHTHINPLSPASQTLADILGYHYFTELAHSAGLPPGRSRNPGSDPREKCRRLFANLAPLENTVQYSWLIELARELFGFAGERIGPADWEPLYDAAGARMSQPGWAAQVLQQSRLEAVFLTNEFDDPLEGFRHPRLYSLPADRRSGLSAGPARSPRPAGAGDRVVATNAATLQAALGNLFTHFAARNARACAISLPPDFAPARISKGRAETAVAEVWARGLDAHVSHRQALGQFVFWTLAEFCADFQLPFDLMIGVNRGVYEAGVHQGRDLYDSRVSLIQYRELFNAFPQVKFPVSVLASVTNQELVSYAWIFPNVLTSGHWWYSNTPAYIEHDLAARLEAVPQTKQIGYYSDMYKLEFGLPKFRMYKRILAKVLAERFVIDRGWTEERAVALGRQVLRTNVERIFDRPGPGVPLGTAAEAALATATAGPVLAGAAAERAASPDARTAAGEDVRMPEEPSAGAGGPPLSAESGRGPAAAGRRFA